MSQPEWSTVYATDYSKLRIDTTGVYSPELDLYDDLSEAGIGKGWERSTIVLDKCTYVNGVLSDNKFHPEHPAWFANKLADVASFVGSTESELRDALCSDDPKDQARAYESLADYFGRINFDGYPVTFTEEEMQAAEYGLA